MKGRMGVIAARVPIMGILSRNPITPVEGIINLLTDFKTMSYDTSTATHCQFSRYVRDPKAVH